MLSARTPDVPGHALEIIGETADFFGPARVYAVADGGDACHRLRSVPEPCGTIPFDRRDHLITPNTD